MMDSKTPIPTVQARRHLAVFRSISFHIGVEKKQIAAPDFNSPNFGVNYAVASVDPHHHRPAVFPDGRFHSQLINIRLEIFFTLPAVAVETLPEISLAIKQAHADQRDAKVGGAFNVIASQYSQATGIDGQGFMDTEFRGKICHGTRPKHTGMTGPPRPFAILILAQ